MGCGEIIKRDEKGEYGLCCGKKELMHEISFQAAAVAERVALDANLLFYDIAADMREILISALQKNEVYRKAFYSFYNSMRRYPKVAATLYSFIVLQ